MTVFAIPIPAIKMAAREIKLRKLAKLSKVRCKKFVVFSGKRTRMSLLFSKSC